MIKMQHRETLKSLTWGEALELVLCDPDYPSDKRAYDASRLRKAMEWDAAPTWHAARSPVKATSKFVNRPFNRQTIEELFFSLRAYELRRSAKTLDNSKSACNRVADFYQIQRGIGYTPFSDECRDLLSLVPSKWDRRDLRPGFHYLSYFVISPWAMTDTIAVDLARALADDFRLAEPIPTFNNFTRAWNKCTAIPGWPNLVLTRNVVVKRAAIDWDDHPELKASIDTYLASGCRMRAPPSEDEAIDDIPLDEDDEDDEALEPLSRSSIQGQTGSLGMVVWALRQAGVRREELLRLSDLCGPGRYRQAMRVLTSRAGGVVNRAVKARSDALYRLARHPGVLTKDELQSVKASHKKYKIRFSKYLETHEDRDQRMLDQLDDPSVMDAFLSLPTLTKNRVLAKRDRHTISCAYAIQRALILEMWLCVPYRIGAFSAIDDDQIITMRLDAIERVLVRGPKQQARNKKSPEHFLNDDTIDLLALYINEYRPLIMACNGSIDSPYLFPGRNGQPKSLAALRTQMNKFVRKNTSLKDWHPHIIRKISPKITLDADPGALEVARRTGGWADDTMLRKVYGQRVHRASQARYLELLEGRRLTSLRALGRRQGPKGRG